MAAFMTLLWYAQSRTRNAGIVDVAWAIGTGCLVGAYALTDHGGNETRANLLVLLGALWSGRLGLHLLRRVLAEAEDGRYRYMRDALGKNVQLAMFGFFQIQAVWALLFALPFWAGMRSTQTLGWLDAGALALWAVAFLGEAVADNQLKRFREDPSNRGQVCAVGMWRYSRHPNYFFEWLHWWAYLLFAVGSDWWWVAALGVGLMYVFLTKITGVPHTEAQSIRSRGDHYRRYQETTSVFFPMRPKSK
ncbi:MAG: DUF1295 domain-containing protein [Gammaproteobacteria bacterium]|nr:DUF1295 domain-containing protein [Gammaproteobacteria bacterium]